MTHSFNLIDEPWIPCIRKNGATEHLGILKTLTEAHNLREVFDESPLVTAALHRFLLAVLHRVMGTDSVQEWKGTWIAGRFGKGELSDYFATWHGKFDLFDDQLPFYQASGFEPDKKTPLKRIAFEFAAQNNPTLFDHSTDEQLPAISPGKAAMWLLTNQAFAPTAGKSATIHTKDSPWSRGAVVLVQGDSLFQTLMLNLIPYSLLSAVVGNPGTPCWESKKPLRPEHGVSPQGYLDYLTWQSRVIRLIPETNAEGNTCVRECYFAQGKSLSESFWDDPLLAYEIVEDKKGKKARAWRLKKNRAVWRDSSSLLGLHMDVFRPPTSKALLAGLASEGLLPAALQCRLSVIGQNLVPGKPTINFWRHERLPLPIAYLVKPELVGAMDIALSEAERIAKSLGAALWALGRSLTTSPGGQGDSGKVKDIAVHLAGVEVYWSRLETPFYELVNGLAASADEDVTLAAWNRTLASVARDAFEEATLDLDRSARTLKAVAEAATELRLGLSEYRQRKRMEVK